MIKIDRSSKRTILLFIFIISFFIAYWVLLFINGPDKQIQIKKYSSFHTICIEGNRYLVMESEKLRSHDTYGGITQMFEYTADGLKSMMCSASDEYIILGKIGN